MSRQNGGENMKCVECKKQAEYVLGGDSCCQEHYDKAIEQLNKEE